MNVVVGATVTWMNADSAAHHSTSDATSWPVNPVLDGQTGGRTRMKFARVVFFVAGMWGLVIVTPL